MEFTSCHVFYHPKAAGLIEWWTVFFEDLVIALAAWQTLLSLVQESWGGNSHSVGKKSWSLTLYCPILDILVPNRGILPRAHTNMIPLN
jgi:hypothetical protein